ncbi:MAG TPA: winged helix-turn-helix domain-containing protein [Solirubrobacterales bacterium]|nr:winged helix-turn-helix domain-containing protein [Solirubrobacterales bacterium]
METKTSGRPGQSGKSIEERVSYALGHRVRVEILTLLNEGVYTADDIAEIIGESRQNVHHHLKELLSGNSIEIAKVEKRRNADLHYYRAVEMADYDEEEIAALPPEARQEIAGLIVQHSTAELMASLAAGKLKKDPMVWLAWRGFNLDSQARRDLADENRRHWERVFDIEAESTNRRAKSGEEPTSFIVATWGFEKSRTAPVPPSAKTD